jgi:hypothetical protein
MNFRDVVGRNAAEVNVKNRSAKNRSAKTTNEKMANHYVKKSNVKNWTTNAQTLSANGSRDALTHPMSRRAYHGLL